MEHRQEQSRMYSGGGIGMRSCGLVSVRMTKSSPLFRKNKTFTLRMHEIGHCSSHPELKPSTVTFQRTRDSFQPKANSGSGIMAHDLEVPTVKLVTTGTKCETGTLMGNRDAAGQTPLGVTGQTPLGVTGKTPLGVTGQTPSLASTITPPAK